MCSTRAALASVLCAAALAPAAHAGILYGAEVFGIERLVVVDRDTAQTSVVGPFGGGGPSGMAWNDHDARMYLVDAAPNTRGLHTVDLATGAATPVGAPGLFGNIRPAGLGYDVTSRVMYTSDVDTNTLYTLDLATGAPTPVGTFVNFGGVDAMTYDNTSHTLWGIARFLAGGGTGRHLVRFDPDTLVAISVISLGSGPGADFRGLAWDHERNLLWTHNVASTFLTTFNPATGAVTPIGTTDPDGLPFSALNALAFVPSPGAASLVAPGLMLALRRRR